MHWTWCLVAKCSYNPPPSVGGGESHLLSSPTLKGESVAVPSTEAGERQTSDYSPPLWPWTSLTLCFLI